ncbi:hypothetical protein [Pulveribacter sp.]|uniref:hypothetical protein n=1 Tax=Pulveribacter sp. TaxID=2678893 RepID=UPI0028AA6B8B|nr:hypothetical protein [Pulveribacter sp.]
MDQIITNIKDPSWWFSAFFIAIVASVFAGFLKDKIERYLSTLSAGIKSKRAASLAARKAIVDSLVEHPVFLTLAFHRAALRMLLYVMAMLLFISMPLLLQATPPEHDALWWFGQRNIAKNFLTPFMGLLSIVVGYRATASLSIALEGFKAYREKHGLPKLP